MNLLELPLKTSADSNRILPNLSFLKARGIPLYDHYSGIATMTQHVLDGEAYKCKGNDVLLFGDHVRLKSPKITGPYDENFGVKTPGGGHNWHPGV
jgi:hypothetical protein